MRLPSNDGGYSCMKCGSTTISLSRSPIDHRGTLSCVMCGGTEDSEIGIAKNGKRISTYISKSLTDYLASKRRYDCERGYHE
jgi:transcription elongation factor Elf1